MPKVVREGKLVDIQPVQLSESCKRELNSAAVAKVLATADREGVPHCVSRDIAGVLEDEYPGCIAFLEMLEGSRTSRNMLWSYDRQRAVAITTINRETAASFQITGLPYKYIYQGPLWLRFLNRAWEAVPTSEPAGLWVIIPTEERDENLVTRMAEEDSRLLPPHHQWLHYCDARYVKRHGLGCR